METLEAYCAELGKVVDIYDAQKAYFALPENCRKRFIFRCSDDACRAKKNPLVSSVDYDKLIEETEKYRQIHFRAPAGNPHLEAVAVIKRFRLLHPKILPPHLQQPDSSLGASRSAITRAGKFLKLL